MVECCQKEERYGTMRARSCVVCYQKGEFICVPILLLCSGEEKSSVSSTFISAIIYKNRFSGKVNLLNENIFHFHLNRNGFYLNNKFTEKKTNKWKCKSAITGSIKYLTCVCVCVYPICERRFFFYVCFVCKHIMQCIFIQRLMVCGGILLGI